jgi:hypothetical protein
MVLHTRGPSSSRRPIALAIAVFLVLLAPSAAAAATPAWLDPQAGWHGRAIERPLAPARSTRPVTDSTVLTVSTGAGFGSANGSATVRRVQRTLRELGYGVGPVDGRFGSRTRSAVGWFQRKHGLSIDGIAGPRTLQRLRERASIDSTRPGTDVEAPPSQPVEPPAVDEDRQATAPATPTAQAADSDDRWLAAALAVAAVLVATLIGLLVYRRRRPPEGTVVSLAQPLWVTGVSADPAVGHFAGTAAALHVSPPPTGSQDAPLIRYCVLDDEDGTPAWVSPQDIQESRSLDEHQRRRAADALIDHPAAPASRRFARPGTRSRRGSARRRPVAGASHLERRVTWFRSLGMPPEAIADLLADEEIPPPAGHDAWTPQAVADVGEGGADDKASSAVGRPAPAGSATEAEGRSD